MTENERKAKEMFERGEAPEVALWDGRKSAAAKTKEMVDRHKGIFEAETSLKDAEKINDIFAEKVSIWSREAQEAKEREWEALRQEVIEGDEFVRERRKKIDEFREKTITFEREWKAREKIDMMSNAIQTRWKKYCSERTYRDIMEWETMDYYIDLFSSSWQICSDQYYSRRPRFSSVGSILSLMEYFGECIRKEIYFLSKYKKELRTAKVITAEINTEYLLRKRNQLIEEYLRKHWKMFVNPGNFNEGPESKDWKFGYKLSQQRVENVIENYITPIIEWRNKGYGGIKETLENFIVEGICIQEFLKEGNANTLSSFNDLYGAATWGFGWGYFGLYFREYSIDELSDETIFILLYCLRCYQYAEFLLDKNVGEYEEIMKEFYSLNDLKKSLLGDPNRAGIINKKDGLVYALINPRYSANVFDAIGKGTTELERLGRKSEAGKAEARKTRVGCIGGLLMLILFACILYALLIRHFLPDAIIIEYKLSFWVWMAFLVSFLGMIICAHAVE
ncbi:MAG: hypothetical protein E7260_11130 [Lachnospiraceae bacterium]|nr:hypothetical protein [Lachnospiraceae bacterium]